MSCFPVSISKLWMEVKPSLRITQVHHLLHRTRGRASARWDPYYQTKSVKIQAVGMTASAMMIINRGVVFEWFGAVS